MQLIALTRQSNRELAFRREGILTDRTDHHLGDIATAKDTQEVHIRVLVSCPIPRDPTAQHRNRKFVALCKALFVDYLHTHRRCTGQLKYTRGASIDLAISFEFHQATRERWRAPWQGVNKASLWT